jgi:hypothetical protein
VGRLLSWVFGEAIRTTILVLGTAGPSDAKPMNNTLPAMAGQNIPARFIGVMTLLLGGAYAIAGGRLLLDWADLLPVQTNPLLSRIIIARDITYLAPIGLLFLAFGIMALAASVGLFLRKPWGRALALVVAVLALAAGLCFHALFPSVDGNRDAADGWLIAAQVLYGILALPILSFDRVEPIGIYVLKLLTISVGLVVVLHWGFELPEFVPGFFPREGTSRGDDGSLFLALAIVSGFVAGLLILATGVVLFTPRRRRFTTVLAPMIAAGGAEVAMAAFALLGGLLGHSKGGLREGLLLVFVFPFAGVLMLLTACGIWYLRRPAVRRALEAGREQRQGRAEQGSAAGWPGD